MRESFFFPVPSASREGKKTQHKKKRLRFLLLALRSVPLRSLFFCTPESEVAGVPSSQEQLSIGSSKSSLRVQRSREEKERRKKESHRIVSLDKMTDTVMEPAAATTTTTTTTVPEEEKQDFKLELADKVGW